MRGASAVDGKEKKTSQRNCDIQACAYRRRQSLSRLVAIPNLFRAFKVTTGFDFNLCLSEMVQVPLSKRARFVGPGGYNLKKLQAETGEFSVCKVHTLTI